MHFLEKWLAGGTENPKRSERLSHLAARCDGLKRELEQVEAQGFDVKLTETSPSPTTSLYRPGKKEEKRREKTPITLYFLP